MRHARRSRAAITVLAAAALCAGTPASAGDRPRIVVLGVRGERGPALAGQLARGLCEVHECLPADRVKTSGKIDFAAAKAQEVAGLLFGTAVRSSRGDRLDLALLTTSFSPARTWALPLDADGSLTDGTLAKLAGELRAELGGGDARAKVTAAKAPEAAPPRPQPAAAPVAPPEPRVSARQTEAEDGRTRAPMAPEQRAPAPASRTPRAVPTAPSPAPAGSERAEGDVRWGAVDLGVEYTQRKLSYSGISAGGATLLDFTAPSIVSPALRAEVRPLAAADGWYAGATLLAAYSRSVGLETEAPSGAKKGTVLSRLDVGAGLRVRPLAASRASVLAAVSYRTLSVGVTPARAIPGLPDSDLAGPRFGLALEAPLGARFALLAGGGYTAWLRAKELVGGFFTGGGAFGLDASAGIAAEVAGPFSIRAMVDYERTSFTLSGTSAYRATGATDAFVGGRVFGRVEF